MLYTKHIHAPGSMNTLDLIWFYFILTLALIDTIWYQILVHKDVCTTTNHF